VGTSIRLTHSTSEITAGYLDNVELGGSEFDFEIVDDHYTVYLIQRQSKLRVCQRRGHWKLLLLLQGHWRATQEQDGSQTENEAMKQTNLRTDRTVARLPLADHMNRFIAGDRARCSPEGAKMLACANPTFDGPVVLFQDIIEVLYRAGAENPPQGHLRL